MQVLLQGIINIVVTTLNALFYLFPDSPFDAFLTLKYTDFIAKINYFLPVYEFVVIGEAWLVSVTIWYAYSVIARWLKAVE